MRGGHVMEKKKLSFSRRSFLKTSGIVGVTSLLGPHLAGWTGGKAYAQTVANYPVFVRWEKPIYPNLKPKYTMKIGHTSPANPFTATHQTQCIIFKEMMERTTKGEFRVEIYPANQLGRERQLVQGVKDGTLHACIVAEGIVPVFFPSYNVLSIPYIFENHVIAWRVLDGWFGKELMTAMREETGIRTLAQAENGGFRNFCNKKRPIHSPADIKGLKLRTMTHPGHMEIVKSMGGLPSPIQWGETYVAVQTGVVDGLEAPISVLFFGKMYELNEYLTLDGHVYGVDSTFVNENWFTSLPKEYQNLLVNVAYNSTISSRGMNCYMEWEMLAQMIDRFKEVHIPSPKEFKMFVETTQPAYLDWYHKTVDKDKHWSAKLYKAVEEARKSI